MKKIVGILSIVVLTSCGGGETETPATTTDSTTVTCDSSAVATDSTKACCDSTKTSVVDSTK
jgi:hypothetical protein